MGGIPKQGRDGIEVHTEAAARRRRGPCKPPHKEEVEGEGSKDEECEQKKTKKESHVNDETARLRAQEEYPNRINSSLNSRKLII